VDDIHDALVAVADEFAVDYADNAADETPAAAISRIHPWATPDQILRIIAGTPKTTNARRPDDYDPFTTEDGPFCVNCGEETVSNLDGVRGRTGHGATADPTCRTAERSAALAYSLRASAAGWAATNSGETTRLLGLADKYDREAQELAKD
jgi:hypothetical protein